MPVDEIGALTEFASLSGGRTDRGLHYGIPVPTSVLRFAAPSRCQGGPNPTLMPNNRMICAMPGHSVEPWKQGMFTVGSHYAIVRPRCTIALPVPRHKQEARGVHREGIRVHFRRASRMGERDERQKDGIEGPISDVYPNSTRLYLPHLREVSGYTLVPLPLPKAP